MLGRRKAQYSIFCAQGWPHRVPAKSFYARMGAVNDVLFRDDDLAGMYCPDNGRPSLPPSLMSGILLPNPRFWLGNTLGVLSCAWRLADRALRQIRDGPSGACEFEMASGGISGRVPSIDGRRLAPGSPAYAVVRPVPV